MHHVYYCKKVLLYHSDACLIWCAERRAPTIIREQGQRLWKLLPSNSYCIMLCRSTVAPSRHALQTSTSHRSRLPIAGPIGSDSLNAKPTDPRRTNGFDSRFAATCTTRGDPECSSRRLWVRTTLCVDKHIIQRDWICGRLLGRI